MVKGLDTVFAWVTDMDRATAFYRGLIGDPVYHSEHWTSFKVGDTTLALHSGGEGAGAPGWFVSFTVVDLDACAELVRRLGGRVDDERHETPRGVVMNIYDPDNNPMQAFQPI